MVHVINTATMFLSCGCASCLDVQQHSPEDRWYGERREGDKVFCKNHGQESVIEKILYPPRLVMRGFKQYQIEPYLAETRNGVGGARSIVIGYRANVLKPVKSIIRRFPKESEAEEFLEGLGD